MNKILQHIYDIHSLVLILEAEEESSRKDAIEIAKNIALEIVAKLPKKTSWKISEALKGSPSISFDRKCVIFFYCPNENDHPNDQTHYFYSVPFVAFDNQKEWIKNEVKNLKMK